MQLTLLKACRETGRYYYGNAVKKRCVKLDQEEEGGVAVKSKQQCTLLD